ncbi:hypothetical protein V7S43_014622 [Phytophthora oleae]|uniref:Uncharacterized protein n=1 Tax=Phytophthora oleae TaxID=2107226 RepID=A0ABD3F4R7_9STRA
MSFDGDASACDAASDSSEDFSGPVTRQRTAQRRRPCSTESDALFSSSEEEERSPHAEETRDHDFHNSDEDDDSDANASSSSSRSFVSRTRPDLVESPSPKAALKTTKVMTAVMPAVRAL